MKCRIVALALTWLAVSCGPAPETGKTQPGVPGVSDDVVTFGNQTDLSGAMAVQGADSIDGARMRFDEVNDAGGIHGRMIRLIVEDTHAKLPDAVAAVSKLIDEDHVFAMFLSLGENIDSAVLPSELKEGVPSMFPLSGARSMVRPVSELKFTERPTYDDEMRAGARYFLTTGRKGAPCVLYEDTPFGREVLGAVKEQLSKMGNQLALSASVKEGQSDFSSEIKALQASKCDVIFLGTAPPESAAVLEAAKKNELGAAFVGTDLIYGEPFTNSEGLYAVTPMARLYKDEELPPKVRLWWDKYEEKYGDEPRLSAMEGYRAADLVVKALDGAGRNLTRKSFVLAMENIKDYIDFFGYHLSFGANKHQGTSESVLSVVDHGKWKVIEKSITGQG